MSTIGFKTLLRTGLAAAFLAVVTLLMANGPSASPVRAASDPASSPAAAPASAAPAAASAPTTPPLYGAHVEITGPTTAFHNSVASRYNYAFGKQSPFLPSNATTVDGQFWSPKVFPTAEYCGHCHQEAYHQWRQSVHSNSFRAPWYLKNVNALIDEKGVQYSRHCEGCHNPVALLQRRSFAGHAQEAPLRG